jgi:hypothetical protein
MGGRTLHGWALVSLHLASLPEPKQTEVRAHLSQDFPEAVPLPIATSMELLARAKQHVAPQLIHNAAHRIASTHGEAPFAAAPESDALDHLLQATSGQSQTEFFAGGSMSGTVTRGGATWETPVCTCEDTLVGADTAQKITMTFHTSRTVPEMAPYADPRRWPKCSSYWKSMNPASMTGTAADWAAPFDEVIEIIPLCPMTTPLLFSYHTPDPNEVVSSYYLLRETDFLDVDEGSITITLDPKAPAGMPTKIVAVKTIHWLFKSLQGMPELLAHTVWSELGLNMAVQCGI